MTQPGIKGTTMEMLAEILCGTAADVVLNARHINSPFGPTFIGSLDDQLAAARPHPSGSRLERGDLVEVTGGSGSGKTTLLLYLLVGTLLPAFATFHYPNPVHLPLGGRGPGQHAALLYPTTHRSPLPRLDRALRQYIGNAIYAHMGDITYKPELVQQVDALVGEALGRLRVVRVGRARCRSWALALKSLALTPPLRDRAHRQVGQKEEEKEGGGLDLVVCDGFGDGFYPERWADEQSKLGSGAGGGGRKRAGVGLRGGEDIGMSDIMSAVNDLRREMGSVVVLSVQGLWSNGSFFSTHLSPPYPAPFNTSSEPGPGRYTDDTTPAPLNIQISLHGPVRPLQLPPDQALIETLYKRLSTRERQSKTFEGHVRVVDGGGVESRGDIESRAGVKFGFEVGPTGIEAWRDATE